MESVAIDDQGIVTVAGWTGYLDFPTTRGAYQTTISSSPDAFVTRFDPTGSTLLFSTFLGGNTVDKGNAMGVATDGAVVLCGWTGSTDFPITPGAVDTTNDGVDAFVVRLGPNGDALEFSTFLGGSGFEIPSDLVLGPTGAITVTGDTLSADFPVTPGAFDTTFNSPALGRDGFVSRLSPDGTSLLYSTFLGGSGSESPFSIAEDATGAVAVTGQVSSSDFPTTPGAFEAGQRWTSAAFLTRLDPTGSNLLYSTYLSMWATGVAVDDAGRATVAGTSVGMAATPGAFQTEVANPSTTDAFLARFKPDGTAVDYATFIGGFGGETASAVVLDSLGGAIIAGETGSVAFPTTKGTFKNRKQGAGDLFVARLSPDGSELRYGTHLGGSDSESQFGACCEPLAVEATDSVVVAGITGSRDFPLSPRAFDQEFDGGELFVTRLGLLAKGVTKYGASTPGCRGPLAIGVTSMAYAGNAEFGLTCSRVRPSSTGLLLASSAPLTQPVGLVGVSLWLDPATLIFAPVHSDPDGNAGGHRRSRSRRGRRVHAVLSVPVAGRVRGARLRRVERAGGRGPAVARPAPRPIGGRPQGALYRPGDDPRAPRGRLCRDREVLFPSRGPEDLRRVPGVDLVPRIERDRASRVIARLVEEARLEGGDGGVVVELGVVVVELEARRGMRARPRSAGLPGTYAPPFR